MTARRWLCFDVGETLIEETRAWSVWSDALAVPSLTLFSVLGSLIERGRDHREIFPVFGCHDWWERAPEVERSFGGFRAEDLYPDALPSLRRARELGYRVAVVANQPASRTRELRSLGLEADVVAMSEELGVFKPDPAFYRRVLTLLGDPSPDQVAYVGDRVDYDILPARAAGLRPVWIRRGPWGRIQQDGTGAAALVVESLVDLLERHEEIWRE